jgi:hypothetical protein
MRKFMFLLVGSAAILTASPVLAAAKHHGSEARRIGVEQTNHDLYQSLSQGRQPYPNPDRQLYVPEYDW